MKKLKILIPSLVLTSTMPLISLVGCGQDPEPDPKPEPVKEKLDVTLASKETRRMIAKMKSGTTYEYDATYTKLTTSLTEAEIPNITVSAVFTEWESEFSIPPQSISTSFFKEDAGRNYMFLNIAFVFEQIPKDEYSCSFKFEYDNKEVTIGSFSFQFKA